MIDFSIFIKKNLIFHESINNVQTFIIIFYNNNIL